MSFKKRRKYYVEKKFQTKYLLLTLLLLLSYTSVFLIILFAPYIFTLYFDNPLAEKAEASRVLLILHRNVWSAIFAVIILFGAVSIFVTHKIAGPLHRLKKSLSMITQGNLDVKIKLRKGDDLQDLAEHVNILVEELRTVVIALKTDYDLLSNYILDIEREMKANVFSEESGRKIIKKVLDSRKNIEAFLEKFKIQQ
jgi:methyl-accepting chemotaxis protein